MLHIIEIKINKEEVKITNDEYFFRELAIKMVSDIPFEELKKLIKLTKTDPRSQDSSFKINDYRTPGFEKQRLIMMRNQDVIEFKAEVDL